MSKNPFFYISKGPRKTQEDSLIMASKNGKFLSVIADGMGGHEKGEIASGLATAAFRDVFLSSNGDTPQEILKSGFLKAYHAIIEQNSDMGTTAAAALVEEAEGKLFVFWIGDSRIYLFTDRKQDIPEALKITETEKGSLFLLTEDDTLIWNSFRRGDCTLDGITKDEKRNALTMSLHPILTLPFERDVKTFPVKEGDRIFLCTDGVWEVFKSQDQLIDYLAAGELKTSFRKLVSYLRGKERKREITDNNSFILFEIGTPLFTEEREN